MVSWSGALQRLQGWFDNAGPQPSVRRFAGWVEPSRVEGPAAERDATKGDPFLPERSYFSVRLVEMRMAEASTYFTQFIPMCSCFLRFRYGLEERTVPFIVGSDLLKAGLGANAPPHGANLIDFRNIYAVRNVPVKATNLTLFAALCRFNNTAFASSLLDLLADAGQAVGGAALGGALRSTVDLTKRLGGILGANGVTTRFGLYDGAALQRSGFLVVAGAAPDKVGNGQLHMRDGQLLLEDHGKIRTIDDVDYLVIAFEHVPTLVDPVAEDFGLVSVLPFHTLWQPVADAINNADTEAASKARVALRSAVLASPDVTQLDRLGLIRMYETAATTYEESLLKATGGMARTRAGDGGGLLIRLQSRADSAKGSSLASLLKAASKSLAQELDTVDADAAPGLRVGANDPKLQGPAFAALFARQQAETDQVAPEAGADDLFQAALTIAAAAAER